jgi:hypothetical protein
MSEELKKAKYPYDYRSIALTSAQGSATFIGKPTPEQIEVVNKMAELAYKKLKKHKNEILNLNNFFDAFRERKSTGKRFCFY